MSNYNKNGSTSSNNLSRFKKSSLAVCIMAACSAQAQDAPVVEEELIVRGIRQSLQTSQDLKRDAATVKDVITSQDINAFPDKSVAEALQRLPGVNIERFAAADDPDHFSVEGSGVVIRGLTRIRSEFNGRDTFSADGSGGLNFSDVPPELLGSVEVVKNATASMIEGGIAGTVNLNTRKPFDKREQQIAITAKGSYGDLSEEFSPSLSGLYSNVWDLDNGGTIGWLISASASELKTRSDGVGLYNYYERSPVERLGPPDQDNVRSTFTNEFTLYPNEAYFAPAAGSIRTQENDRERLGLTTSLQWANSAEDITATLEYVRSESRLTWIEHYIQYSEEPFTPAARDSFDILPDQGDRQFRSDANNVFLSGIVDTDFSDAGARINDGERILSDLSLKLEFDVNENFVVTTDFQYMQAENNVTDTFANIKFQHNTWLDLRGDVPEIEYLDTSFNRIETSPTETFYRSILDHVEDSEGDQRSFAVDMEYTFDEGIIQAVKGGMRVASREQTNKNDNYANWGNISEVWSGGVISDLDSINDNGDGDLIEEYQFDNFHRGGVLLGQNTFTFPTIESIRDARELDRRLDEGGYVNSNRTNLYDRPEAIDGTPFIPADISTTSDDRKSAYLQVDFGFFATDSIEFRGNAGLRYVDYSWESVGSIGYPNLNLTDAEAALVSPDDILFGDGSSSDAELVKGTNESDILPSINLTAVFNDEFLIRAAASKALFFPDLGQVSAQLQIRAAVNREEGEDGELTAYTIEQYIGGSNGGNGGNPFLKPETSDQFDLSFEWYFSEVGSLTAALFYKEIDDIIRNAPTNILATNNGVSRNVFAVGKTNSGDGIIRGIELAYQQTYDFLPAPFDGFGTQINYTYLEQSGANNFDPAFDNQFVSNGGVPSNAARAFSVFTDLPLEGLSQDTVNLVAFYENDTFNVRLAYNWRSSYLLNSRDVIAYAPVYANDTGQLDGSFNYRVTDNISVGMEFNNLLDEVTETQIQYSQQGTLTPRNYFINDRRVSLTIKGNF